MVSTTNNSASMQMRSQVQGLAILAVQRRKHLGGTGGFEQSDDAGSSLKLFLAG